MAKVTLDCIGLPCPQPVLRTKDALEQGTMAVEVRVDNEASRNNVVRFAESRGHQVTITAQPSGHFTISITATVEQAPGQTPVSEDLLNYSCDLPKKLRLVYVISADSMGRGSDELGWALLQTYIQTIKDIDPLPEKIIFYNSGVKLTVEGSPVLQALRELESSGVKILVCGTCANYFQIKDQVGVGIISNMYAILEALSQAGHVIYP